MVYSGLFTRRDDDGKASRAETFFHVEAPDQGTAYKVVENADWKFYEPVKFGYIIPGWHGNPAIMADKIPLKKVKK